MKVTMLGHATVLFETQDLTVLADPVLRDTFADDSMRIYPRRELHPEQLPALDAIYISHRHHDHFDLPTLAMLRDKVQLVLCPDDPLILGALKRLGYPNVTAVGDRMVAKFGSTELRVTPSQVPVPEHGLVLSDDHGRVWNQVDTMLSLEHRAFVLDGGPLDLHLANFNPVVQDEVLNNIGTQFPCELYGQLMEVTRALKPKLTVPGATGFALVGANAWLNAFIFPVGHQAFVDDIRQLGHEGALMFPGDAVEITNHVPRLLKNDRPALVRTVDPSLSEITFNPNGAKPALRDENPQRLSAAALSSGLDEVLAAVEEGVRAERFDPTSLTWLRRWKVVWEIRVHVPEGVRSWHVDFGADTLQLRPGGGRANLVFETVASGLVAVHRGEQWDSYLWGGQRSFHRIYRVHEEGLNRPSATAPGRLGFNEVPRIADVFMSLWGVTEGRWLDHQLTLAGLPPNGD